MSASLSHASGLDRLDVMKVSILDIVGVDGIGDEVCLDIQTCLLGNQISFLGQIKTQI